MTTRLVLAAACLLALAGCGPSGERAATPASREGEQTAQEALAQAPRTIEAQRAEIEKLQRARQRALEFKTLLAQKQALEARVEELMEELRSARIQNEERSPVVREGAYVDLVESPQPEGQVLRVDETAGLAVISLGTEDGVRPGFRYTVSRGSSYVAILEITDVQARESAGRILRSLKKSEPQVGDRVRSR